MRPEKLTHPPLVEAILEVRWQLQEQAPGVAVDPKYKLLVGRLYDRLNREYPFHEPLPTASMPDEMLGYVVQHRFRTAEDAWPLVQVGPGLVTLNDTQDYTWKAFEAKSRQLVDALYSAYPDASTALRVGSLQLRYINAIPFDFEWADVLQFLAEHLKITLAFSPALLTGMPVKAAPKGLNVVFEFSTENPAGALRVRLARGKRQDADALILEMVLISEDADAPATPADFPAWLDAAHNVIHDTFFKMIEGRLEEQFR
ncbi:MAG: TIGR04255 family protein [Anaerolineae bacterium]